MDVNTSSDLMVFCRIETTQRVRARMLELNDLRAGLVESEGKEQRLRSSVLALGGTVHSLDKELR